MSIQNQKDVFTKLETFLENTYNLKTLIRYNNTPRILHESIAEHMYFVALTVYELYHIYTFDLLVALKMALFHDIPEIFLSDIPSNTKKMFPDMEEVSRKNQEKAINLIDSTMSPFVDSYEHQNTFEAKIVKLADILSVLQYTKMESNLGNLYMRKIYETTKPIAQDLIKKITQENASR